MNVCLQICSYSNFQVQYWAFSSIKRYWFLSCWMLDVEFHHGTESEPGFPFWNWMWTHFDSSQAGYPTSGCRKASIEVCWLLSEGVSSRILFSFLHSSGLELNLTYICTFITFTYLLTYWLTEWHNWGTCGLVNDVCRLYTSLFHAQ